jgi:hypothetical protein
MLCCVLRNQGDTSQLARFRFTWAQEALGFCILASLPLLSNAIARLRNACVHRVEKGLLSHATAVGVSAYLPPAAPPFSSSHAQAQHFLLPPILPAFIALRLQLPGVLGILVGLCCSCCPSTAPVSAGESNADTLLSRLSATVDA